MTVTGNGDGEEGRVTGTPSRVGLPLDPGGAAQPTLLPTTGSSSPAPLTLRAGSGGPALGSTFYDDVGGSTTFRALVDGFYRRVAEDRVLREMYPEEDLGPAADRLFLFLQQYWGGPTTYSQERGHPRLRMRHSPFRVGPDARDRWLTHMGAAVDDLQLPELQRATLWDYLERAAHAMVNAHD